MKDQVKRRRAAAAIRQITDSVYRGDGVPAGKVYQVIREHSKTILAALEPQPKRRKKVACNCQDGACSNCYTGPVTATHA